MAAMCKTRLLNCNFTSINWTNEKLIEKVEEILVQLGSKAQEDSSYSF